MKARLVRITAATAVALMLASAQQAHAQLWQAASQLQSLISPALSGSGRYKGSAEVMGVAGIGSSKLNHVEISTSQGYQYTDWFYMGAGLGVDIVRSSASGDIPSPDTGYSSGWNGWGSSPRYGDKKTGVMIPVFTDFRFNIPTGKSPSAASLFVDLRLGATWLVGNRYLRTDDGWLSNNTNFYFRPAIGARIPVNSRNPRQAVNIGVAYLLITSGNNYWYYDHSVTLSAIGATVSFEW